MSKEGLLHEEPIELDVYGSDTFFEVAKELAKPFNWMGNWCETQRELSEAALKVINSDLSREEKAEVIKLLWTRDPIMWHLLCLHTNTDTNTEEPKTYLRKFILALVRDSSKIRGDYLKIVYRKRWNLPLKEEYREFQKFVDDTIPRDMVFCTLFLCLVVFLWIVIILTLYFLSLV